jgi:hypothetical protein
MFPTTRFENWKKGEDAGSYNNFFQCISDKLIEPGSWSRARFDIYKEYLCSPKSRKKEVSETLGEYYPPLDCSGFSLWKALEDEVDDNYYDYPDPFDQLAYAGHNKFQEYKKKVKSDGSKMSPLCYAEFACYFLGNSSFIETFIKDNVRFFPTLAELVNMYLGEEAKVPTFDLIKESWYALIDDTDLNNLVKEYGEEKYYNTLKNLFGSDRYHFIRLNM